MLSSLVITDIVLIDRAALELGAGLNVLTGETGAGKSILLDALGLALGARGDSGLIRGDFEQGSVTACFDVAAAHPVWCLLSDHDLADISATGGSARGEIRLRRTLDRQGRGRAFVNDQPVGVALLRAIGEALLEVHGQGDQSALDSAAGQRGILDLFGGHAPAAGDVESAWQSMREAAQTLDTERQSLASARAEEDYLRFVLEELDQLAPQPGEEQALAAERSLLQQGEKLGEAFQGALLALTDDEGVASRIYRAERALARFAGVAGTALDTVLDALARVGSEATEALAAVEAAAEKLGADPDRLAEVEERLFALRALARKHRVETEGLPALREAFERKLSRIEASTNRIADLERERDRAREQFRLAVQALGQARRKSAKRLEQAVALELGPLKLGDARFEVMLEPLDEAQWSRHGGERVVFRVATNPGAAAGPLSRIASGGERSRFMLALKVALADARTATTLIFDEVDRGVGGATADAVGERLSRLARDTQILVVTHSPQVAARADHHWRVDKSGDDLRLTQIACLDEQGRREEIARMLSGAEVTGEARAAADSLLQGVST